MLFLFVNTLSVFPKIVQSSNLDFILGWMIY